MSKSRKSLGKWGEGKALEFLQNMNFKIEKLNYRKRIGEIDLICWDKGVLVFIEVKTTTSNFLKTPQEGYSIRQQCRLRKVAQLYLVNRSKQKEPLGIRFDFVGIKNILGKAEITHLKNVTLGGR